MSDLSIAIAILAVYMLAALGYAVVMRRAGIRFSRRDATDFDA